MSTPHKSSREVLKSTKPGKEESTELTWASVNLEDPEERARFYQQEDHKARHRVARAVKSLQKRGIIDAHGRRIRTELPPDMQPSSKCTLPE